MQEEDEDFLAVPARDEDAEDGLELTEEFLLTPTFFAVAAAAPPSARMALASSI